MTYPVLINCTKNKDKEQGFEGNPACFDFVLKEL